MYKIVKVTNNIGASFYYNVVEHKSFLFVFKRWKTVKYYQWGTCMTDKDFSTLLCALDWIREDMLQKKFKESKQVEFTFSTIEQVESAIKKIHTDAEAERDRINNMSDEEYYNGKKTNTKDESTNRETKA